MKKIYKGAKDFCYYDIIVANPGDLLDINDEDIENITRRRGVYTIPSELVEQLLEHCVDFEDNIQEVTNNKIDLTTVIKNNQEIIPKLLELGILKAADSCRNYNIGKSNYSKHVIQPWAIWQDYNLNPWDADIVKRILRTKSEEGLTEVESRILDYQKIIHICQERMRQLNGNV